MPHVRRAVLVTGASGLVGRQVVERLAGEPRPVYVALSPSAQTAERGAPPDGAFLGVSVGGRGGSDGLSLSSVLPGTGAARAGLANGDVIVQLGDQPIDSFEELRRALADRRPGDSVGIVYLRDGVDYRTTATLGTRP